MPPRLPRRGRAMLPRAPLMKGPAPLQTMQLWSKRYSPGRVGKGLDRWIVTIPPFLGYPLPALGRRFYIHSPLPCRTHTGGYPGAAAEVRRRRWLPVPGPGLAQGGVVRAGDGSVGR